MKSLILALAFFFVALSLAHSQQILGGDITWKCVGSGNDAGKYIFQLTLFNQCDSGAVSTSNQTINVYNGPISSITASFVKEENISLACYDSSQTISCNKANSGGISMAIYRSSPVTLSGIPGAGGWKFTWTNCCRPSNSNVSGSPGYTLRSIMYNYQNTNMNPCFDNSPQFLAPPVSRLCNEYSTNLNHYVNDPDLNRVEQTFAEPWDNSTTWPASPVSFNAGYSYSSPFPNLVHDSSNVPATLHNPTGNINFTSFTSNKIQHTVRISSYKNNILISDVFRDFTVDLVNCPPTATIPPLSNVMPYVVFKDSANASSNRALPPVDTVWAGSEVKIHYSSTDIQFLPGYISQTNYMKAYSGQFGSGYLNTATDCDLPPCAKQNTDSNYSSPSDHWFGQFGLSTDMTWQTDSSHGIQGGKAYNFYYQVNDDWCPSPGINVQTYSVVVLETPSNWISGKVFEDVNGNGSQDAGEADLQNILVRQLPSHFYYNTNAAGEYILGAYTGSHDISIRLPKYHTLTTPSSGIHTVVTSGSNNTYANNDFGVQIIPNINDLSVDLTASSIYRPGFSIVYYLSYKNAGTSTLNGSLELEVDNSLLSLISTTPTASNISGNVYTWNFSGFQRNSTAMVSAKFKIDTSASAGDSLLAFAKINPISGDTIPSDNTDSLKNFLSNSYDPNNKESYPTNVIYESQIRNKSYIEYTVNFQNTGNAPAINVKVEDWISEKLNMETIEHIASSHTMEYEIRGRKITWYFNNINLPDSSTDFDGSMGFVKFRIIADSTMSVGDTVFNAIHIFFDFNDPIYAENKLPVVKDPIIDGISDVRVPKADKVRIYPNPSEDKFFVQLNGMHTENLQYQIFSISGNLLDQGVIRTDNDGKAIAEIDLTGKKKGIYFLKLNGKEVQVAKKIVLK